MKRGSAAGQERVRSARRTDSSASHASTAVPESLKLPGRSRDVGDVSRSVDESIREDGRALQPGETSEVGQSTQSTPSHALLRKVSQTQPADDAAIVSLMALASASAPAGLSEECPSPGGGSRTAQKRKLREDDSRATGGAEGRRMTPPEWDPPEPERGAYRLASGASIETLKRLAAAFKLCPTPNVWQLESISQSVELPTPKLAQWFATRRALQEWASRVPSGHLNASLLMEVFYPERERGAENGARRWPVEPPF